LTQDNPTVVRRFVEEVINHGQMDSAAQFVWEDVVEQVRCLAKALGWKV